MKINPIGINAYQQIARTGKAAPSAAGNNQLPAASQVKIQPQSPQAPSRVSIKPHSANNESIMTVAERNALDSLLKIVNEKSAANAGYARDNRTVENPEAIGNFIDVKV
jgi:hypothetical protein